MNYYSEKDIRDIVAKVLAQAGIAPDDTKVTAPIDVKMDVPIEISARHIHPTKRAVEVLFGQGYELTQKRELSQKGQFLAEERVKLVTTKGELANVAVLGPVRDDIQIELSMTDARVLGVKAPVRLSGDLAGAAEAVIIGPCGVVTAHEAVIVAKSHVHMSEADALHYGVEDGERVSIRLHTERPVTLNDVIIRVHDDANLAVHIDFDEANAAELAGATTGTLLKNR